MSIEQKQLFLREVIIQRGLDKDSFVEYMSKYKQDWQNLQKWTISQLNRVVKQFTEKSLDVVMISRELPDGCQEKPILFQNGSLLQPFSKEIKLKPPFRVFEKSPVFKIVSEQTRSQRFFIFFINEEYYSIKVEDNPQTVHRKASDFHWLRKILLKLYPFYSIPFLPSKRMYSDKSQFNQLQIFQTFLDELAEDFVLSNCKAVYQFMTVQEKDFILLRKQFDNLPNVGLQNLQYPDDKINIVLNNRTKRHMNQLETHLPKLKRGCQQLSQALREVRQGYLELQKKHLKVFNILEELQMNELEFNSVHRNQDINSSIEHFFQDFKKRHCHKARQLKSQEANIHRQSVQLDTTFERIKALDQLLAKFRQAQQNYLCLKQSSSESVQHEIIDWLALLCSQGGQSCRKRLNFMGKQLNRLLWKIDQNET